MVGTVLRLPVSYALKPRKDSNTTAEESPWGPLHQHALTTPPGHLPGVTWRQVASTKAKPNTPVAAYRAARSTMYEIQQGRQLTVHGR